MDRKGLVCRYIHEEPYITQRELAQEMGLSLGSANRLVKDCIQDGFIAADPDKAGRYCLLEEGKRFLEQFRVDGAVIIAAGFGSRFVPLTFETPKGLLEVFGERMIERQICQLHEAGVRDITIVVGYLKEKFEYLMDRYDVKLLYNREYSSKNTLATIHLAGHLLKGRNMYILSSDNWMRRNLFHAYECGSWYSSVYMEGETSEWCLDFTKKGRIVSAHPGGRDSWVMYGPVFLSAEDSLRFLPVLDAYYGLPGTETFYWEHVLMELWDGSAARRLREGLPGQALEAIGDPQPPQMDANRQPPDVVYEFENLEELRVFDPKYRNRSDNQAMELVSEVLGVPESHVTGLSCLKAGMTNKSFLFTVDGKSYICRIPGPGTDLLINRREEEAAFKAVSHLGITEHALYMNGETGYKIAEYYEGARNADPSDPGDVARCMEVLRRMHGSGVTVGHSFSFRERISFYEKLCKSQGGILFEDYEEVHRRMERLLDWLDGLDRPRTLAHIDSVPDNFIFLKDGSVRLIDWEYAGMCDPLADLAMWSIYSYYQGEQTEELMRAYLERTPTQEERRIVFAYMALGGFLWSLWAVYKSALGEEFGEYTILMYRYAKNYYKKVDLITE